MIRDFMKGLSYTACGIRIFFHDRKSWKYALFPWCFLVIIYFITFRIIAGLTNCISEKITQFMANLPAWLSWFASLVCGLSHFLGIIAGILILGMTVGTLYEVFGGFFFDSLVDHYETGKYGPRPVVITWKSSLKYSIESFLFGIRTALAFCGLFIISLFFPVIGQILLIISMGYFFGLSYIICSANRNGATIGQLKKAAGKRFFIILGFGVSAYFLLMIPLAAIIFLPGLVLGGSELFNRELKEYV